MLGTHAVVIGIEQDLIGLIDPLIARYGGCQHKSFEEPRGMRQVPFCRTCIWHRTCASSAESGVHRAIVCARTA